MPFGDNELAQQIGYLTINLWRLATELNELKATLAKTEPKDAPVPPAE